jgi:outer membrane receptor protein involved in Fe transport
MYGTGAFISRAACASTTSGLMSMIGSTPPHRGARAHRDTVANAALTLSGWHGFTGSLRHRHTGNYRLVGTDVSIRASGLDVIDLSVVRRIRNWVDLNLAVDNLTNKRYYETQNYFDSRLRPGDDVVARIHGTPGYPAGVTVGLTFHIRPK